MFGDVDLSNTRGLEYVYHIGPFTVGIDTMIASGGAIPKSFLRGCGVPENFIQYMSSLTVKAFEYYSCFISYSSKDQDFADRLYADLQNKGVRCWFAQEDIKGGKKIPQFKSDGIIRIRRETKNRQGKTVTTVFGFDLDDQALKIVAKDLKQPGGAFFKL